jgi:phosphinothricin acetyltransferase
METQSSPIGIRPATPGDGGAIVAIYNHYIASSIATFEEEAIDADEMRARMATVAGAGLPWLVAEDGGRVTGYAYATKWRGRPAYRFSCEITVYLASDALGQGFGTALYGALFPILEAQGLHLVIGGIALPNEASVALHERFGMTKAAHFHEVGFKFGRWVDVAFWERRLSGESQ